MRATVSAVPAPPGAGTMMRTGRLGQGCDWAGAAADLLKPLYDRMLKLVLGSNVIWTDDTPVRMLDFTLVTSSLKGDVESLEPKFQEVFQGRAEVRNTFKVPKAGVIAGCMVTEGLIPRTASIRLLRDNRVIYEGKIGSLRHFKNDVSEVRQGFECGIGIEKFQDIKVGDVIEAYKVEELKAALA